MGYVDRKKTRDEWQSWSRTRRGRPVGTAETNWAWRPVSVVAMAVVGLMLGVFAPCVASADTGGGANNVVIASNMVNGSSVTRDHVQVAHDPSNTVANQNVASAQSSNCAGCRTVAVAMQVVIVESYPQDFRPANAAVASNGGCASCQTYAFAFQYVIQPGHVVYLSSTAQQQLVSLRQQVDAVAGNTTLSYLDMKAQLDPLFSQIVQTVSQDIHAVGQTTETTQAA